MWPAVHLESLPHGSQFKPRKMPRKAGRSFIFYGEKRKKAGSDDKSGGNTALKKRLGSIGVVSAIGQPTIESGVEWTGEVATQPMVESVISKADSTAPENLEPLFDLLASGQAGNIPENTKRGVQDKQTRETSKPTDHMVEIHTQREMGLTLIINHDVPSVNGKEYDIVPEMGLLAPHSLGPAQLGGSIADPIDSELLRRVSGCGESPSTDFQGNGQMDIRDAVLQTEQQHTTGEELWRAEILTSAGHDSDQGSDHTSSHTSDQTNSDIHCGGVLDQENDLDEHELGQIRGLDERSDLGEILQRSDMHLRGELLGTGGADLGHRSVLDEIISSVSINEITMSAIPFNEKQAAGSSKDKEEAVTRQDEQSYNGSTGYSGILELIDLDFPVQTTKDDYSAAGEVGLGWSAGLALTPLSGAKSWIPGVNYASSDPLFLHAFVNGFVPAISPQRCHPQLTPMAVFMPQGIVEPMMREVFYACGAAFIANTNPTMQTVARRRYASCLTQFANRLTETGGLMEEWMVAAALLFTLRDKFSGLSAEHPTTHLAKAVELIRIFRRSTGDHSITLKFFVDSFLFNYSVVLLTGGPLALRILPSPFDIFDEWRPIFEFRPFQCFAPWMNNPVFGAANRAFELAAKVLWLAHRTPLDDNDMILACQLLAESYLLEAPKQEIDHPPLILQKELREVRESVAVHEVCNLLCQLFLIRLMHPELELLHAVVSARVRRIVDVMHTISKSSRLWIICSWLLMVTGLCAKLESDREFIASSCLRVSKLFRAQFLVQIEQFLRQAWGTDLHPGTGWSLLFESDVVLGFCL